MLPESLYRDDEYLRLPEKPRDVLGYRMPTRQDFREQVLNGAGMHSLSIRSDGVRFEQPSRKVDAGEGGSHTVKWTGVIESAHAPWVIVVIPDGDVTHRKEITSLPW